MTRRTNRRRARGVTLIEVLIVVAILSLLAAGVAVAVMPTYVDASIKITHSNATTLRGYANGWRLNHPGECPDVDRLVKDGVVDAAASKLDAWKKPFRIRCEAEEIYVTSGGPDGKLGTEDDIEVPDSAAASDS